MLEIQGLFKDFCHNSQGLVKALHQFKDFSGACAVKFMAF